MTLVEPALVQPDPSGPDDSAGPGGERFRILFVCAANVCRSVMAERLTRRALLDRPDGRGLRFRVSSAGLSATTGEPAHPYTVAALARLGANASGFAARRLTADLLLDSDLVLTATQRHRDRAVAMLPAASRRIFTIREFVRLAEASRVAAGGPGRPRPGPDGADRLAGVDDVDGLDAADGVDGVDAADGVGRVRWTVHAAAVLRGQLDLVIPGSDDIADPACRPGAFRACARGIAESVGGVVAALCPAEPATRHTGQH
jgi:protein-tyrosine phosphatase